MAPIQYDLIQRGHSNPETGKDHGTMPRRTWEKTAPAAASLALLHWALGFRPANPGQCILTRGCQPLTQHWKCPPHGPCLPGSCVQAPMPVPHGGECLLSASPAFPAVPGACLGWTGSRDGRKEPLCARPPFLTLILCRVLLPTQGGGEHPSGIHSVQCATNSLLVTSW